MCVTEAGSLRLQAALGPGAARPAAASASSGLSVTTQRLDQYPRNRSFGQLNFGRQCRSICFAGRAKHTICFAVSIRLHVLVSTCITISRMNGLAGIDTFFALVRWRVEGRHIIGRGMSSAGGARPSTSEPGQMAVSSTELPGQKKNCIRSPGNASKIIRM